MEAVILAAGRGSRLQAASACKPLTPLLGTTLLERNVRLLDAVGANRILVVTGYRHHDLHDWHRKLPKPLARKVELVHNAHWSTTENGYSAAVAARHLSDDFLLLMADHVYSLELLQTLIKCGPGTGATLAIDRRLSRASIDFADATKVQVRDRHILALGKELEKPDAFDTGAFFCNAHIIRRLATIQPAGDTRLSSIMQQLADEKIFAACDVSHTYWHDIDTPADLENVRNDLLASLTSKSADGPVAKYLNRPCSRWITRRIVHHEQITPNKISLIVLGLSLLAAFITARFNTWPLLVVAGLLIQLASVLDGCDGEIARLRCQSSAYGGWLDAQLDRYGDAILIAAVTWQAMQLSTPGYFWLGIAALVGSFMTSYSAHKADRVLNERIRIGRDLRMLILALGVALQLPVATLWILAVAMNLVVLVRLYRMRYAL